MRKLLLIAILLSLGSSILCDEDDDETEEVKAIKCYTCNSQDSIECRNIEKDQAEFLKECSSGKCFVKEEQHPKSLGNFIVTRGCGEPQCVNMESPVCCQCSSYDGCNYNNLCGIASGTIFVTASNILVLFPTILKPYAFLKIMWYN